MDKQTIKKAIGIYPDIEKDEDSFILALRLHYRFKYKKGKHNLCFHEWLETNLTRIANYDNQKMAPNPTH